MRSFGKSKKGPATGRGPVGEHGVRHFKSARLRADRQRRHGLPLSKRTRGARRDERLPFIPPEDWHEPREDGRPVRFLVQPPGLGYRHVLTIADVCQRLAVLPSHLTRGLEIVQFSRMTRKKQGFPCYGMQWGAAIYLYPIEVDLVETHCQPPKPAQKIEAQMYGGRWYQEGSSTWKLVWTEESIRDFYLNNVLIHELGHLVDQRNQRFVDRERYAEWFALQFGYRATRGLRTTEPVLRRHGA